MPNAQSWPADHVERLPLDSLVPDARNARMHSDAQVAQIAASIREWGWTIPVLVDEQGTIIAGHGRVLAALKLGLTDVPVMTAKGWSDSQRRAYVIADNKLAENADWDRSMLRIELEGLTEEGFNLDLVGFSEVELTSLFLDREEGENDPNAEWAGMPGFEQEAAGFHHVVVHFSDQDGMDAFAQLVGQPVTKTVRYLWFPPVEPERVAGKVAYAAA
ncbi:MAG TPA: ParB/Srx family N-terminal domain-containing protein [Caulobacteraceae bacterium]|jgi:hypothetical protein